MQVGLRRRLQARRVRDILVLVVGRLEFRLGFGVGFVFRLYLIVGFGDLRLVRVDFAGLLESSGSSSV